MVDELERFFRGEEPLFELTPEVTGEPEGIEDGRLSGFVRVRLRFEPVERPCLPTKLAKANYRAMRDKLAFVDSHVHFYDLQHPELVYKPLATRRSASDLGVAVAEAGREKLYRRGLCRGDPECER